MTSHSDAKRPGTPTHTHTHTHKKPSCFAFVIVILCNLHSIGTPWLRLCYTQRRTSLGLPETDGVTYFSSKNDDLFSHRFLPVVSTRTFRRRLSKFSHHFLKISFGCHPLDGVTRGGPPLPPLCDATGYTNYMTTLLLPTLSWWWWPGVVVSAMASINEVNQRRARLVLRWVTDCPRLSKA